MQAYEREPSDAELAEMMDMSTGKIGETLRVSNRPLSFDSPLDDEGDGTLLDVTPDTSSAKTDKVTDEESLREDIRSALLVLTPRERDVIIFSFGLGCPEMSPKKIAVTVEEFLCRKVYIK